MIECFMCNGDARFCGCSQYATVKHKPPTDEFRERYRIWADARNKRLGKSESGEGETGPSNRVKPYRPGSVATGEQDAD